MNRVYRDISVITPPMLVNITHPKEFTYICNEISPTSPLSEHAFEIPDGSTHIGFSFVSIQDTTAYTIETLDAWEQRIIDYIQDQCDGTSLIEIIPLNCNGWDNDWYDEDDMPIDITMILTKVSGKLERYYHAENVSIVPMVHDE